jgi:hypothetical protein
VFAVLALAACSGEDQPREDAHAEGPPPLRVAITGNDLHSITPETLSAKKRLTLFGRVRGGSRAQRRDSVVEVYARPYGRRGWRRVASKRGGDEVIGFRLRPQSNTRYQLRLAGKPRTRSKQTSIYLELKGKVGAELPAIGVMDASYRIQANHPIEPANGTVHFYIWPGDQGPLHHVGSAKPRSDGPNAVIAAARVEDSRIASRVLMVACGRGLLVKGHGHPDGTDPACGAPTIRPTEERVGKGGES